MPAFCCLNRHSARVGQQEFLFFGYILFCAFPVIGCASPPVAVLSVRAAPLVAVLSDCTSSWRLCFQIVPPRWRRCFRIVLLLEAVLSARAAPLVAVLSVRAAPLSNIFSDGASQQNVLVESRKPRICFFPLESPLENPLESPLKNPLESPLKNPLESPLENPLEGRILRRDLYARFYGRKPWPSRYTCIQALFFQYTHQYALIAQANRNHRTINVQFTMQAPRKHCTLNVPTKCKRCASIVRSICRQSASTVQASYAQCAAKVQALYKHPFCRLFCAFPCRICLSIQVLALSVAKTAKFYRFFTAIGFDAAGASPPVLS